MLQIILIREYTLFSLIQGFIFFLFRIQVPQGEVNKFLYIKDVNRRRYAAMVSILDKGVGQVVKALDDKGILNNTVILFTADNGAPSIGDWSNSGSNFPFKGVNNFNY